MVHELVVKKRILMLGGSYFQIPAIKYAKDAGYYVITCDYLPDNPGHVHANEWHNLSTTDLDGVLDLAKRVNINGIVAYASDPAAPTAAYVSEQLNLSGNSYESVKVLTEKDLYRDFLRSNDFNTPLSKGYDNYEKLLADIGRFDFPLMVKPVDSSGSKGVMRVKEIIDLKNAFEYALTYSRSKRIVVEEFIEKKGAQIGGDGFVVNGELIFLCLGDQLNDLNCNPFVPIGMVFPSSADPIKKTKIHKEIQRALSLLDFKQGAINIEVMFDSQDNIYLMELGPRSGGNCIPEVIRYATCFDIIKSSVEVALGNQIKNHDCTKLNLYHSYYAIHSDKNGILEKIEIAEFLNKNIIEKHVFKSAGDEVKVFNGSDATLGILILKYASLEEMIQISSNMSEYVNVELV